MAKNAFCEVTVAFTFDKQMLLKLQQQCDLKLNQFSLGGANVKPLLNAFTLKLFCICTALFSEHNTIKPRIVSLFPAVSLNQLVIKQLFSISN